MLLEVGETKMEAWNHAIGTKMMVLLMSGLKGTPMENRGPFDGNPIKRKTSKGHPNHANHQWESQLKPKWGSPKKSDARIIGRILEDTKMELDGGSKTF